MADVQDDKPMESSPELCVYTNITVCALFALQALDLPQRARDEGGGAYLLCFNGDGRCVFPGAD
jgi:hypothetical protein